MSIEITVDTKDVSDAIGKMIGKIDHFKRVDIGMELSDFQTEDMHRHRPFTMRSRARGMATTKIRQHSLFEMERSAAAAQRFTRARRQYLRSKYYLRGFPDKKNRKRRRPQYINTLESYRHWSMRPILREEMESRLWERMIRARDEKITWE